MKLSQKIKLILAIFLLMSGIATQKIIAQENHDTLALLIWIEDALGQKDSVFIYVKTCATREYQPEFGEINIIETPMKDPEIRIIQRKDTNAIMDTLGLKGSYWLTGDLNSGLDPGSGIIEIKTGGWLESYRENVDLKKLNIRKRQQNYYPSCGDDSSYSWIDDRKFALYINANNYPVKLNLEVPGYAIHSEIPQNPTISIQHITNGQMLGDSGIYPTPDKNPSIYEDDDIFYTCTLDNNFINEFIMLLEGHPIYSIKNIFIQKNLYPNPATSIIKLEDCNFDDKYRIFNNTGIIVKSDAIDNEDCTIDVSNLINATYYIKIKNSIYKLIKLER